MWEGYPKRESTSAVRTWLAGRNISMEVIHTSGHASVADLKRFAAALAPQRLVPIHSFATERSSEEEQRRSSRQLQASLLQSR
jgi:ribonuclease J